MLHHGDGTEFDNKVTILETSATGLDFGLLFGGEGVGHLEHEQIEDIVGDNGHLFAGAIVDDRERGGGILGVVQDVDCASRCSIVRLWRRDERFAVHQKLTGMCGAQGEQTLAQLIDYVGTRFAFG